MSGCEIRMLELGDRIRVLGSSPAEPDWTWGRGWVEGVVAAWFQRPDRSPACFVTLGESLLLSESESYRGPGTGQFLVLRLRYKNTEWKSKGVVHVEVFAVRPVVMDWDNREHWVDGQASYELVSRED